MDAYTVLNTIDAGFETEVQAIVDSPAAPLDMSTASAETRQRGAKLYGLLASLCRNRSLNIIRSVKQGDGFEGLRQLILNLRPSTKTTGFSIDGSSDKLAELQHEPTSAATALETGRSIRGG